MLRKLEQKTEQAWLSGPVQLKFISTNTFQRKFETFWDMLRLRHQFFYQFVRNTKTGRGVQSCFFRSSFLLVGHDAISPWKTCRFSLKRFVQTNILFYLHLMQHTPLSIPRLKLCELFKQRILKRMLYQKSSRDTSFTCPCSSCPSWSRSSCYCWRCHHSWPLVRRWEMQAV